ncbi:hypothetical protein ACOKFD_01110 [Flagellimonas sp. S174]|uniref:hypothetical protein n=1 Tax=Flagellimonas sp. S174 TaxID=3410790 RepID=UPI003BF47727
MKNIFTILGLTLLTSFAMSGQTQHKSGKLKTTINKTFSIEKDGTETQYNLKIMEHRDYPMKWEKEDSGMVDQDREYATAKVTKLIAVDNDNDNEYEQYFVLKYRKAITDEFTVVATEDGFAIKVEDNSLQLFEREGIYFIDNTDQEYFTIEEFREIG